MNFKISCKMRLVLFQTVRTLVASHNCQSLCVCLTLSCYASLESQQFINFLMQITLNGALFCRVGSGCGQLKCRSAINKLNSFMPPTCVAQAACIFRGENAQKGKSISQHFPLPGIIVRLFRRNFCRN